MSFVASCPFCRRQVQAPDGALGQSVACKRCGNSFTLAPKDEHASKPAPPPSVAAQSATASPGTARTKRQPAVVATDTVEHSVAGTTPDTPPLQISSAAAMIAAAAMPAVRTPWNPFAVTALLLGGAALLFATVSWLQWLTVPLAGAGLLAAVICLLGTPLESMRDAAVLMVAGVVTLGGLVVALCWPAMLGMDERLTRERPPERDSSVQTVRARPDVPVHGAAKAEPLDPARWVEADRFEVDQGNVRLRIAGVALQDVPPALRKDKRKEKELVITVQLGHVGFKSAPVSFLGWQNGAEPVLQDGAGHTLAFKPRPSERGHGSRNLVPFSPTREQLAFAAPAPSVETLRLELPASVYGGAGTVRFQIPKSMIGSRPSN